MKSSELPGLLRAHWVLALKVDTRFDSRSRRSEQSFRTFPLTLSTSSLYLVLEDRDLMRKLGDQSIRGTQHFGDPQIPAACSHRRHQPKARVRKWDIQVNLFTNQTRCEAPAWPADDDYVSPSVVRTSPPHEKARLPSDRQTGFCRIVYWIGTSGEKQMVSITNLQQKTVSACSPYILDKHTTRNPLRDCEVPVSTQLD
jgi:hypothetical protein